MTIHKFFSLEEVKKAAWRMQQQGRDIAVDANRLIITEYNSAEDTSLSDSKERT
jgi:hypothetical protein